MGAQRQIRRSMDSLILLSSGAFQLIKRALPTTESMFKLPTITLDSPSLLVGQT